MNNDALHLFNEQLVTWDTARRNYEALCRVETRDLVVDGVTYRLQHNPARIISSGAKTDVTTISKRPCFLCADRRPAEQMSLPLLGHYELLVNPYPIFPRHFTIVEKKHTPQRIAPRFRDMLEMAQRLCDYFLFYNGPACGASAPDHAHFQAGSRGMLPIESMWRQRIDRQLAQANGTTLYLLDDTPRTTLVIEAASIDTACGMFHVVYDWLPILGGEEEPRLNTLALYDEGQWNVFLFPRAKHRPVCYDAPGKKRLLCSPASVDLGGVFILPRKEDFLHITADDIAGILREVCLPFPNQTERL